MSADIVAYVPVVHQGYLRFFSAHPEIARILVLDRELTQTYEPLQKDIRALDPAQIVASLRALLPEKKIDLATPEILTTLNKPDQTILLPDEDISRQIAGKYLSQATVKFETVFLRWDHQSALAQSSPTPVSTISLDQAQLLFMTTANEISQTSADWWRQVGAVLVKNEKIILQATNHHLPTEQQTYIDGDPRANFHKKEYIELSTAMHAEASLIAQAASQGIAIAGASLYVTTFPCPVCAKLVAESGIKEVYYAEGYAMLDGERIMNDRGVKLIKVTTQSEKPQL